MNLSFLPELYPIILVGIVVIGAVYFSKHYFVYRTKQQAANRKEQKEKSKSEPLDEILSAFEDTESKHAFLIKEIETAKQKGATEESLASMITKAQGLEMIMKIPPILRGPAKSIIPKFYNKAMDTVEDLGKM